MRAAADGRLEGHEAAREPARQAFTLSECSAGLRPTVRVLAWGAPQHRAARLLARRRERGRSNLTARLAWSRFFAKSACQHAVVARKHLGGRITGAPASPRDLDAGVPFAAFRGLPDILRLDRPVRWRLTKLLRKTKDHQTALRILMILARWPSPPRQERDRRRPGLLRGRDGRPSQPEGRPRLDAPRSSPLSRSGISIGRLGDRIMMREWFEPLTGGASAPYVRPARSCSRSIDSKSARKFPAPKPGSPLRWMISKKNGPASGSP